MTNEVQTLSSSNRAGYDTAILTAPDGSSARIRFQASRLGKRRQLESVRTECVSDGGTEYVVRIRRQFKDTGRVEETFAFTTLEDDKAAAERFHLEMIAHEYDRNREKIIERSARVVENLRRLALDIEYETQRFAKTTAAENISDWHSHAGTLQHALIWGVANMGIDSLMGDEVEFRASRVTFLSQCVSKYSAPAAE